jgi:hypothetical protein
MPGLVPVVIDRKTPRVSECGCGFDLEISRFSSYIRVVNGKIALVILEFFLLKCWFNNCKFSIVNGTTLSSARFTKLSIVSAATVKLLKLLPFDREVVDVVERWCGEVAPDFPCMGVFVWCDV